MSDRALLRRASVVIALQTGLATAAVVAVVIALVYTVSLQERRDATEHKLRDKLETALSEAAGDPPRASVIVDAPPDGCAEAGEARLDADDLPLGYSELDLCGTPFLAYAADAGAGRAAYAMDIADEKDETQRLARLSVLAGMAGVLAAAGVGWLVARRAVRPLGDALAAQRNFVADASHELRTPVAILHTRAQLLQRQDTTGDEQRHEIDQLVDDARELTEIVNDLLLSAEIHHHRDARRPVDLGVVATEVTQSFAATAEQARVDLVVDAEPDGRYVVEGAPSALRRAVAALVDNAMHHVSRGGTVTVSLTATGRQVRVAVIDDGEGLDPKLATELTQRFRRGPTTSAGTRRFGLGLALVEEVVHAHDGTMTIDGEPGGGATVTLTFPAA